MTSLLAVIDHYNQVPMDSKSRSKLDTRLLNDNRTSGQDLRLTEEDKDALVAFLRTLTGSAIYTDERWSNPFDASGELIYH